MKMRIRIFTALFCLALAALLGQVFYLTKARPAQTASSQNTWKVTVATVRGTIYDRNLRPVVNEEKEYRAALIPGEPQLAAVRDAAAASDFSLLRDQLSNHTPAAVRLQEPVGLMEGLELFFVPRRVGSRLLAPHLIGYLDHAGEHGVSGVELACDDLLNQYAGEAAAAFAMDGSGNCLSGAAVGRTDTTANAKGGVVLTVDRDIQTIVEDVAADYIPKGAVVVMDPYDGSIVAMASFPTFQPDTVADSILQDNGALLNRALAVYDCGSVFKTVTMATALEKGISSKQCYSCSGSISMVDTTFHCHNRLGHGPLHLTEAFAQSCNVCFIRLAQDAGAASMYAMANNFGFDQAITLVGSLGAAKAIMPDLATLKGSPAAVANLSFGQGYLMASPLHVARMVATVVNDGVMPPVHLIAGYADENGEFTEVRQGRGQRILSVSTAATLRSMMRAVVQDGTGKAAAPELCTAAGKTGTAETGQTGSEKPVVQSWFAGYFPAENPRYVITVLAEDAQNTGGQSAKCFCEISNKLYEAERP